MSEKKDDNSQKGGTGGKELNKNIIADLDSIDVFPLEIMPIKSPTLKKARLIKNARMETALELYNDPISGSLQISPQKLGEMFSEENTKYQDDHQIIQQLAALGSFDVFSLRTIFKKLHLETIPEDALDLSDKMKAELLGQSQKFIRPLIEKVYGVERFAGGEVKDLRDVFRDPNVDLVRENLRIMTQKTGIPLNEIPAFLEEYNDVFLAVAYYNYSLESIHRIVDKFFSWIHQTRTQREIMASPKTMAACEAVEGVLQFINMSLHERLARIQKNFDIFWGDINRTSFIRLREDIASNHQSLGAVLCGLIVKMRAWEKDFPTANSGGPQQRSKFIVSELEPGLERLKTLEQDARRRLGLTEIRV